MLFDLIKTCNKTALILPERQCKQMVRRLQGFGHEHVFIGEEAYADFITEFKLQGVVHPNLIRRSGLVQASGVWIWRKMLTSFPQSYGSQVKQRI